MLTPPSEGVSPSFGVTAAASLLQAKADALAAVAQAYGRAGPEQEALAYALEIMRNAVQNHGKIVFSGMGKSYKIAEKLAATLSSFGICSAALHAGDAFHGDMGLVQPRDCCVMISASGRSPELLALIPFLPPSVPRIALTIDVESPLAAESHCTLSIPVPADCDEKLVTGLAAPTISSTATVAVGDALCVSLNEALTTNAKQRQQNFAKFHPGGAIGQLKTV